MKYDEVSGLWHRGEGEGDLICIRGKARWHATVLPFLRASDRLMDVGAHVGSWSRAASDAGLVVKAYEPDPETVEVFRLNCPAVRVVQACVGAAAGVQSLYLGRYRSMSRGAPTRGRNTIQVPRVHFLREVNTFRPTVITSDCEGGEYDFLLGQELPPWVRLLDLEVHLHKPEWKTDLAPRLIHQLRGQGWEEQVEIPPIRPHWQHMFIHTLWARG